MMELALIARKQTCNGIDFVESLKLKAPLKATITKQKKKMQSGEKMTKT